MTDKLDEAIKRLEDINTAWQYNETSGHGHLLALLRAHKEEDEKLRADNKRLLELVESAYFRGWKDGSATGKSDSPDWNAGEDWRETDIRRELNALEAAKEVKEELSVLIEARKDLIEIYNLVGADGSQCTDRIKQYQAENEKLRAALNHIKGAASVKASPEFLQNLAKEALGE